MVINNPYINNALFPGGVALGVTLFHINPWIPWWFSSTSSRSRPFCWEIFLKKIHRFRTSKGTSSGENRHHSSFYLVVEKVKTPFEKYAREIGSWNPKDPGWKFQIYLSCHHPDDPKLQKIGVHVTTTGRGRKHHLPSYLKGRILVPWRVTLRLNVGEACWRFRWRTSWGIKLLPRVHFLSRTTFDAFPKRCIENSCLIHAIWHPQGRYSL